MVIDGGPKSASSFVYSYIRNTLNRTQIDYIVSTHPHVDRVGGLASVLNAAQAVQVVHHGVFPIRRARPDDEHQLIGFARENALVLGPLLGNDPR